MEFSGILPNKEMFSRILAQPADEFPSKNPVRWTALGLLMNRIPTTLSHYGLDKGVRWFELLEECKAGVKLIFSNKQPIEYHL